MTKVEKIEATFDPVTGVATPAILCLTHECDGCSALGPDECFHCTVCGRRDARLNPTPDDCEALERALVGLRQLDRSVLEQASTSLLVAAGSAAEPADNSKAMLYLSRIAYVLAFEGLRG